MEHQKCITLYYFALYSGNTDTEEVDDDGVLRKSRLLPDTVGRDIVVNIVIVLFR